MSLRDAQARTIYLKDYQPPAFLIDQTRLRVELGDDETLVHAELSLRRNPAAAGTDPLVLHGEGLGLRALAIDGRELAANEYRHVDGMLHIVGAGSALKLSSTVAIRPQDNSSLEGLYRSRTMYCTQCEAEGFRKITFYLDRPDVMAEFTTTIVADKSQYPVLLANGNPIERGELPDNRHWVTWHDPFKKPAYLFAMVAGDLDCVDDSFVTSSGREVALKIYVEAKDVDKCA
ncbi:MAG: aminopeptidase N, partial [Porticoccaceae bacterium]